MIRQTSSVPLSDEIEAFFSPGGPLARALPGYEHRPEQTEMALAVGRSLEEKKHLLVEAGTGTGKSLAYLVPALLLRQRVVVATRTKNLQEQLFSKDLPILEAAGLTFRATLMKGRDNYLCKLRYREFARQPLLPTVAEGKIFTAMERWAGTTESGDREEFDLLRDDTKFWRDINARADTCLGQKCSDYEECFLTLLKISAGGADLLIVNHHLFFADLALRQNGAGSMVFPDYSAVIFDEAHEIEETAAEYFGQQLSQFKFRELVGDARAALRGRPDTAPLETGLAKMQEMGELFFAHFESAAFRAELRESAAYAEARPAGLKLALTLARLGDKLAIEAGEEPVLTRLSERARQLGDSLAFILDPKDAGFVHWVERQGQRTLLGATPIAVRDILAPLLFAKTPCILTSATLKGGDDFSYARRRLGVETPDTLDLPSPFDYTRQAALFIPADLPAPDRGREWEAAVLEIVPQLLRLTDGHAFVLMTSFRMVDALAEALTAGDHGYPLLIQGEMPRGRLLERFRTTPGAVLLATQSFWQGVDVQGPALSQVIIDKLPFPVPSDPLVKARSEQLKAEGSSPFNDYFIPQTAILLKQGLGRLIRSREDHGILALLDSRALHKSYGKRILAALPPYPRMKKLADLESWWTDSRRARGG